MKYITLIMLAALIGVVLVFSFESGRSKAASTEVLLLHGWNGNASSWTQAKADYEAAGFTVHALTLNSGWWAGDTVANANTVEAYIAQHGLTNVQCDGHSLGGWLCLELDLVRQNPAITSTVIRDTGQGCIFGIPGDQCPGSALIQSVTANAGNPANILRVAHNTESLPGVDCNKVRNISHNAFLSDAQTTAWAIAWAQGGNPCSSTPSTPTATSTLAPSSTPTAVAPSPTSTVSPSPTSTPSSCSWWQRLFGLC